MAIKPKLIDQAITEVKKTSFWRELVAVSTKASSMRFVFLLSIPFILTTWAASLFYTIHKLAASGDGLAALASVLASLSGGAIGLVTALAGSKAYQTKNEKPAVSENPEAPK